MRRKEREIKDFEKMMAILKACDCCRIGLVDGDEAYIVPMNFGYEVVDNKLTLYFHCAKEGRKIDLIPNQKSVTFEMDTKHTLTSGDIACAYSFLYQCVMGKGTMEILNETDTKIYGLQKVMAHYTEKENWEFMPSLLDRTYVLKLTVTEWSCKEH